MLEMRNVFSSHIDQIGYDDEAQEMHVVYSNGSHVVYSGVPPQTGQSVLAAPSIGSEVWRSLRGRHEHRYHRRAPGKG